MPDYYLDLRARVSKRGRFVLHTGDCAYGPASHQRISLGYSLRTEDALNRAAEMGVVNVETCPHCCSRRFR